MVGGGTANQVGSCGIRGVALLFLEEDKVLIFYTLKLSKF